MCTPCSSLFEGCTECTEGVCLAFAECKAPFALQDGKCAFCAGTVSGGACDMGEGLSGGVIAGIVVAILIALAVAAGAAWYVVRCRRNRKLALLEAERKKA